MKYEIAWEFIEFRMKALKVNLKAECEIYGFKYSTMQNALSKKLDIKSSQIIFLAEVLDCDIQDLFRKIH